MTINTLLMILALAVGAGTAQSADSDTSTPSDPSLPETKIEKNCWINGVWYNPCPEDTQTGSLPPKIQPPG